MFLTAVGIIFMFWSLEFTKGQLGVADSRPAPRIIFSAVLEHDSNVPIDQRVVYNKVYTNIGNAYSDKTGIFTAPIAGVYVFHIHVLGYLSNAASVYLYQNDDIIVSAYGYVPASWGTGSNTVILELEAKDTVHVKSRMTTSSLHGGPLARFATFSGYLI